MSRNIKNYNNEWRVPNDEEKELALYWIKRNRTGNIKFPIVCFLVLLIGIVADIIVTYIFKPEYKTINFRLLLVLLPFLVIIGGFNIYNMITEIQKVRMISQGEFQIIDAKVQYVGQKRMARYAYMDVVEASYHTGFGAKPTTFSASRKVQKKTKVGDDGYVIRFLNGNLWTKKSLVFIPKSK